MIFRFIIYLCISLSIVSVIYAKKVRIVGGVDADIREFPHLASLRKVKYNEHLCGATIITEWHLLTAAHCFADDEDDIESFRIYTGTSNSSDTSGPSYKIADIEVHSKYIGTISDMVSHHNDIAVVTVWQRIVFNEFQNKARLPFKESRAGQIGYLSGWGSTSYPSRDTPDQLQKAKMVIVDHEGCAESLDFHLHPEQLCAYQNIGVGSCIGDSGGPLTVNGVVVGIASFILPCARGVPDIYTDVYNYLDFILPLIKM